jgi:tRNA A37 threonylcarbamoyladenosine dehydratase
MSWPPRWGVGRVILVDLDRVCVTNVLVPLANRADADELGAHRPS